jgi:ubiquinone/menaquinone biosynthesis C-methylase UbiE
VTVLQLLDDPARGISELQRVLKEGGAAAISVLRKASFAGRLGDLAPAIRGEVYDSETMKDVFLIGRKA